MTNRFRVIIIIVVMGSFLLAFQKAKKRKDSSSQVERLIEKSDSFLEKEDYDLAIDNLIVLNDLYQEKKEWDNSLKTLNAIIKHCDLTTEGLFNVSDFIDKALDVKEKVVGSTLNKGIFLKAQGERLSNEGYIDSSNYLLEEARKIFEINNDWTNVAWTTIVQGVNSYYIDDYDEMEGLLTKTEDLSFQKKLEDDVLEMTYNLLSVLYHDAKADYEKAIDVAKKSLDLALNKKDKIPDDYIYLASIYNNMAVYVQGKGDVTRALHYYKSALNVYEDYNAPDGDKADVLSHYGSCLTNLGRFIEAKACQKQALEYNQSQEYEEDKLIQEIYIYRYLSKTYREENKIDSALLYINQAKDLAEGMEIAKTIGVEKGDLLFRLGKTNEAFTLLKSIEDSLNQEFNLNQLFNANLLYNTLGKIYAQEDKYELALSYLDKALANNNTDVKAKNPLQKDTESVYRIDFSIESLENKALVYRKMGKREEAFQTYEVAILWIEKMRQEFTFEESKIKLNERSSRLYKDAVVTAYELYEKTGDTKYLNDAFVVTEKQKGILLLESMIDDQGRKYYGVPEAILERERSLKNNIAFYKQKALEAVSLNDEEKVKMYETYFTDFGVKLGELKDSLRASYKQYYDVEYQSTIADIDIVQEDLIKNNEEAFVQYLATDSIMYVFVIEQDRKEFLAIPYGEHEQKILRTYKKMLNYPRAGYVNPKVTFHEFLDTSYIVYQMILEPIMAVLTDQINSVTVVPDGILHYIPFGALLREKIRMEEISFIELPYLIQDYHFNYGYSATLLLQNKEYALSNTSNSECLAYAPLYERTTSKKGGFEELKLAKLEGAAKEVQAISEHFDGSFDFSKTATKANFEQEMHDYGILHLAMHGKPNIERPDFAHLIFSPNEDMVEGDNLLYHYEVTNMRIDAQLAVLSACETGVGRSVEGEGIVSLGRGFMYAGVPTVVMSLWKMSDLTTSEIMPYFYKNLADGMEKDKALRKAKLDYLNAAYPEAAHPFFWAGFVSMGEPQPLKVDRNITFLWWISGASVVLLLVGFSWMRFKK